MNNDETSHASLDNLTVLILTFNEQDNIERTLESVRWAKNVLILDSFSDDNTLEIANQFSNVTIVQRKFDSFAGQCNFGLEQINTEWTLSMDADYVLPLGCEESIAVKMATGMDGFVAEFDYLIHGRPVRGSILPGRTVLYRTQSASYENDGHGHRVKVDGDIGELPFRIAHDDRKSFSRWCRSQITYAKQEAEKLTSTPVHSLNRNDRIRRLILVAPLLVFILVFVVRGGFLSGWRGFFYASQRFFAELLLSLFLLDRKLSPPGNSKSEPDS